MNPLSGFFVDFYSKRSYNNNMEVKYNLERVNPDLYFDIDDLAMDTVGQLEQRLAEKGIALSDKALETLYDNIRVTILNEMGV